MDTQTRAKKAAILKLMHGYPSSQSKITEEVVDAYLDAVEQFSPEAVLRACQRFAQGDVPGQSLDFLPPAASVAAQSRMYDQIVGRDSAERQMDRIMHTGIVVMDFGHGNVNMVGLTQDEQDKLVKLKGILQDGRNAAWLTLSEKRDGLSGKAIERKVTPRLRRV